MEYSLWYKQITAHLAEYKEKTLGIPGAGYHGRVKYDFILPRPYANFNFMLDPKDIEISEVGERNKLNSSRVLGINFFLPMIDNDYALLNRFVSHYIHKEVKIVSHAFHHAPRGNGTLHFDFYCTDSEGREFFFEIRYTEKGFEKCVRTNREMTDGTLIEMFNRLFKELVNEDGGYLAFTTKQPLLFMKEHYAVYRHAMVANSKKKTYCFFITCGDNEETKNELTSALKEVKNRNDFIKTIEWETAIPYAIEASAKSPSLQGYYMELRDKYLLNIDERQ